MELTPRQYRALCSICDTFLPAAPGWPSAVERGVPAALATALDFNPRTAYRWEFVNLLDLWETYLHSFIEAGHWSQFSQLPAEDKYKVMLSWADSRLTMRRAAFQALRKAVGFLYVMLPGAAAEVNPVWENLGYPGPIGVQHPDAPRIINVIVPNKETMLTCDVCVIGSGAGGGVAAAVLAAAGKQVTVLEAGGYFDDADFDGAELTGYQRLYAECGFASTRDHSVGFLAGECVGGGTVVNYCTSFRTPQEIRDEWADEGVEWIRGPQFTKSLDAVCERISVNTTHNRVS